MNKARHEDQGQRRSVRHAAPLFRLDNFCDRLHALSKGRFLGCLCGSEGGTPFKGSSMKRKGALATHVARISSGYVAHRLCEAWVPLACGRMSLSLSGSLPLLAKIEGETANEGEEGKSSSVLPSAVGEAVSRPPTRGANGDSACGGWSFGGPSRWRKYKKGKLRPRGELEHA